MAAIMNPVPGMTEEELISVYKNRKALGLEDCTLESYLEKYRNN